jgi:carbon-monoxide dehydrogenase medium subunit
MKPAPFSYHAPTTVEAALDLLAASETNARVLAGGQSLVPMLALRLARPEALIDLNRIPTLTGIALESGIIRIGAMVRQAELLRSPLVASLLPLLGQALVNVGHPPTRARGTIGGSLSHSDPAAELSMVALAYDAEFVVRSRAGERWVPASGFTLGTFETALRDGEILTEIRIDPPPAEGTAFVEMSRRKGDFALVSALARIQLKPDGTCTAARVMFGATSPVPVRCGAVEDALVGRMLSSAAIRSAAELTPLEHVEFDSRDASLAYRKRIVPVFVRRAIEQAAALAGGGRA